MIVALAAGRAVAAKAPQVTVETGTVAGSVERGVESWKVIPYAASPTGPLRWRAPQPPAPWKGVRQATAYRNAHEHFHSGSDL
jgi:para-nitrobenzyl esterase